MAEGNPLRLGRHIVFTGSHEGLACQLADVPDPAADELLVRVTMAGVCGTDAHRLAGRLADPPAPISMGHESVGVVEALGSHLRTDRTGQPLSVGDRVHWIPAAACGRCRACTVLDDQTPCRELGWPAPAATPNAAGFREFATVTSRMPVLRIPDEVPDEAVVALGCALPTAVAGIRRLGGISSLHRVVIQGAGPVGLAATLVAASNGAAEIVVVGAPADRLEVARRLGATLTLPLEGMSAAERGSVIMGKTNGWGADVVIEASGQLEAFQEGIALLGPAGRYLILGLYAGAGTVALDPFRLNNRNLRVIGSFASGPMDLVNALALVRHQWQRVGLDHMVSHRFALEHTEAAVAAVAAGETIKAVVVPAAVDG